MSLPLMSFNLIVYSRNSKMTKWPIVRKDLGKITEKKIGYKFLNN